MPEKIKANWVVSLFCDCPNCNKTVDLLDYCDFWEGKDIQIGEHMTSKSTDVEVMCPECRHKFKVDLEY